MLTEMTFLTSLRWKSSECSSWSLEHEPPPAGCAAWGWAGRPDVLTPPAVLTQPAVLTTPAVLALPAVSVL